MRASLREYAVYPDRASRWVYCFGFEVMAPRAAKPGGHTGSSARGSPVGRSTVIASPGFT